MRKLDYQKKRGKKMKRKPEQILQDLMSAREAEVNATALRLQLEIEAFESVQSLLKKPEGQETVKTLGFSVTVNRPMVWKLDEEKYRKLTDQMPDYAQFHRTKLELDKIKYLSVIQMTGNPEVKNLIKKMQDCVTVKEGKIAVAVTKID
jgi:alkylated DNA repair dioxygenase AlkB